MMKANIYIVPAAIIAALTAMPAQAKLQTIPTHTPPAWVDSGCGKGKPVYTLMPSGDKVCKLPKKGGVK
jgi:hypothetical protein